MQASLNSRSCEQNICKFSVGDWIEIEHFGVVDQYGSCKATTHQCKLICLRYTKIKRLQLHDGGDYYDFVDFQRILNGVHCDDYLVGKSWRCLVYQC